MQLDFNLQPAKTPAPKVSPPAAAPTILGVTALTRKIRSLLESGIGDVWVEGEISNLRRQSSGHLYFTLKDANSQLQCVMFAGQTPQLRGMNFNDGAQVQVFGELTVYEPRGNYQLVVRRVQEKGVGALQARFEELKRRLAAEGLFDSARKRPLPKFPRRLGVVTSPTGAAIRDFLNVLHRRNRGIEVVIFPVRVQGKGAAAEIAEAIDFLATSLAASAVPVVSAVGHEIDFTISDFAADLRAPTPSAAAEILSADSAELLDQLAHLAVRLRRPVHTRLEFLKNQLASFERTALFLEPPRRLREHRQTLDRLAEELHALSEDSIQSRRISLERHFHAISRHNPESKISELGVQLSTARQAMDRSAASRLRDLRATLDRHAALLGALNPNAALARGYTITMDSEGRILRSAAEALAAAELQTQFPDGVVRSLPRS
jgi:exodeoxyribonuclease VII large subunit